MMDLIDRKAVRDGMMKYGFHAPDMTVHEFVEDELPPVPAVPLDKLCEWLDNSFPDPPCCLLENVRCKMECRGFSHMDYSECWRYILTKWMEGLDGID